MDLLDLWCGCLSWRKLSQYVRWLPKEAALYQSMRMARDEATPKTTPAELLVVDELRAMQHDHHDDLVLAVLNLLEAKTWANADPKQRGEMKLTLPPGYALAGDTVDVGAQLRAYFASIQPAPTQDDQPEVS